MITQADIVIIEVAGNDYKLALENAKAAAIGGVSRIYSEANDRERRLLEDQLVGQLGQIAGHRHLFGMLDRYVLSRWFANQHPELGDGGCDVPGANIDFKASRNRYPGKDLLSFNLVVRPAERHAGWVYYLMLTEDPWKPPVKVHIMGWATDDMLPATLVQDGPLEGTHALEAGHLNPTPRFKWNFGPK